MTFKNQILLVPLLFLAACTTTPKRAAPVAGIDRAQWETKARITDLRKNKTQNLSIDVVGARGGPMRMEVTALMGVPVASVVVDGDGFRCAAYRQKTFYTGGLTEETLRPLLGIPLSPEALGRIAFDEPIGDGWTCRSGDDRLVLACESPTRGLTVVWNRDEERRRVRVTGSEFEMDWVFGEPLTPGEFREAQFRLEAPKGFKVIAL